VLNLRASKRTVMQNFKGSFQLLQRPGNTKSKILLPPTLMDGYLVHCAVLARNLDVLLLPRQVLLAGRPGSRVGAISFAHGVPKASTLAGVTHAQDKRLRRMLLNRAGLPTPPGITFSSKGSANLQRFVSRHGYPFVLKEAIGENPSFKLDNISNMAELQSAVSRMRVRTQDHLAPARSLVTSAYAENILNFDHDEEGSRIAPPRARLLIEKRVSGRYIRCLVCGDRILAVIEIDEAHNRCAEMLNRLHAHFKDVVLHAASVIPGLAVSSVDLVVKDPTEAKTSQNYYVVEISERPRLDSYSAASPHLGADLADALVRFQAERSAFPLRDPSDNVAVRVRVEGLDDPTALPPPLSEICRELHLFQSIQVVDVVEGVLEGHLQGAPRAIALVLEALMSGFHFGQRATATDIWQMPRAS
jgi:hypothetical protein